MQIKIEVVSEKVDERNYAEEGLEKLLSLVASNPQTPNTVLSAISKKQSPRLLCQVASNPHTDLNTLDELARDDHESVRACVADHPKAMNFMWKLANDESAIVRYVLASNDNLPEHLFNVLAKDEDVRVARRAKRTLRKLKSQDSIVGHIFSIFMHDGRESA